jgi:apoptotic chromatin condensation inducer in the nucleus
MPRKSNRATSGSSPEKQTTTRRTTRRGQKVDDTVESEVVPDEIPAHLLRASDESSEQSDNDSDYGSPKKGRGRGRGRGRKPKETPEEKPTPSTRPRRGRRARGAISPTTISEEAEQHSQEEVTESTQSQTTADEHETSTMESEPAAEVEIEPVVEAIAEVVETPPVIQQQQQHVEIEIDHQEQRQPSPEKVSEVTTIEQDLQSNNDQGPVDDVCDDGSKFIIDNDEKSENVIEKSAKRVEQEEKVEMSPEKMQQEDDDMNGGGGGDNDDDDDEVSKDAPELPNVEEQSDSNSSEKIKRRSRSSSGEIREESNEKMDEDPPKAVVETKIETVQQKTAVESKPSNASHQRKRKWGARKTDDEPVIAITTDSLKNVIAEPVPLSDVKLLSPSPDREPEEKRSRTKSTSDDKDAKKKLLMERLRKQEEEEERRQEQLVKVSDKMQTITNIVVTNGTGANNAKAERKVTVVNTEDIPPISPPKNSVSRILCITNLVRPLTMMAVKSLLARTGKIADFWIDGIKSKCFVKYETEE